MNIIWTFPAIATESQMHLAFQRAAETETGNKPDSEMSKKLNAAKNWDTSERLLSHDEPEKFNAFQMLIVDVNDAARKTPEQPMQTRVDMAENDF